MSRYIIIRFDFSDDMAKLDDMITEYLSKCGREDLFERADDKYDMMRLIDNWMKD